MGRKLTDAIGFPQEPRMLCIRALPTGKITGPKGQAELKVREWVGSVCPSKHDRDTNAALNIKQRGTLIALKELEAQRQAAFVQTKELAAVGEAKACEATVIKDSLHNTSRKCVASGVGHDPLAAGILAL